MGKLNKKSALITALVVIVVLAVLIFIWKPWVERVNFKTIYPPIPLDKCWMTGLYDEKTGTIIACVVINCAAHIDVEKVGSTYKIIEKPGFGAAACTRSTMVLIFNASKDAKVEFISYSGKTTINLSTNTFCGWSTYGPCETDEHCVVGGLYGEVCGSLGTEQSLIYEVSRKYEHLGCFDKDKYNVKCKCVNRRCQWVG